MAAVPRIGSPLFFVALTANVLSSAYEFERARGSTS
jgi:hypothetical protein